MHLDETVDFYIKSAWHSMTRMYNQLAMQHGITQATGYVLLHIEREGTPATKIAPLMGMEPTSLSRLLKNMEKTGLIYKKIDSNDKRVVRIYLTEEGVTKRKIAKQTILAFNEKILKTIENSDVINLIKVLKGIKDCVQIEMQENENNFKS